MSESAKEPKVFKSVSVPEEDRDDYIAMAKQISQELGVDVSVRQYLKMASDFYKANRKKGAK